MRLTKRRMLIFGVLTALFLTAFGGAAFAADVKPVFDGTGQPNNTDVAVSLNMLWVVIGAILVIFMQAGFALVETGFTRAKHAAHVVSTNFAIFGLGFVGFFLIGFPLMFGGGFSYAAPPLLRVRLVLRLANGSQVRVATSGDGSR